MNTLHQSMSRAGALFRLLALLSFLAPIAARAAHDHEHVYVTMVEYVGYDRDSQHYIIKVKRVVEGEARYYYLHFLGNASSLRGHEGERMQVSLSGDGGAWARLSFGNHGTWQIHLRERAD